MTWFLTSRLGRALAAVGAALVAILTFGAVQRRKGRKEAENAALRRRVAASDEARKVQDDVAKISDDAVRSELRGWMRDSDE